jgi:7-cyano-7-deazaguanine synthase in queuosine biosynthesis
MVSTNRGGYRHDDQQRQWCEGNGSGEKVSTLVSGGLDSAVLVAWAKEKKYDQLAFFVNYGQDNLDRELASARVNTQRVGVPLEVVDISPLRNSFRQVSVPDQPLRLRREKPVGPNHNLRKHMELPRRHRHTLW